jgi:hypothetical protein
MIGSRIVTLDKRPADVGYQVSETVDVYDSAGKSTPIFQTGLDKVQAHESAPFSRGTQPVEGQSQRQVGADRGEYIPAVKSAAYRI